MEKIKDIMCINNVVQIGSSKDTSETNNNSVFYFSENTQVLAHCENDMVSFVGQTTNAVIDGLLSGVYPQKIQTLFQTAVNNRTRERNYFRLLAQLSNGELSETEFEKELDANPDLYIVEYNCNPSIEDIQIALNLVCDSIIDVNDLDDFSTLFSFEESSFRRLLSI